MAWDKQGSRFVLFMLLLLELVPSFAGCGSNTDVSGAQAGTRNERGRPIFGSERVAIHDIQGIAHLSPFLDSKVESIKGVVTRVLDEGFFLQDPEPDSDERTSEAVFVRGLHLQARVGDEVVVSGVVRESRSDCDFAAPDCATLSATTIDVSALSLLSSDNLLPECVALGPDARRIPERIADDTPSDVESAGWRFDPETHAVDFFESLEAMRVLLERPQVVGPSRDQRSFAIAEGDGRGRVTGEGGLLFDPSSNPQRVCLHLEDDAAEDIGQVFTDDVVGVLAQDTGYCLWPEPLPELRSALARRSMTKAAQGSSDELVVAALNAHNLTPDAPALEFQRLARLIVSELARPDLLLLSEIGDDSADLDDGTVSCQRTLRTLDEAMQAEGGDDYAALQIDPEDGRDGGKHGANIRQVLLYRTTRIEPYAAAIGDAQTPESLDPGPALHLNPGRIEPASKAFIGSRKPLAAQFTFGTQTMFVLGNHFVSKLGDDPAFGRFQPPRSPSAKQRTAQAEIVANFAAELLEADPEALLIVLGDFNDRVEGPALQPLQDVGLQSLYGLSPQSERYSYVFEGNSEAIDHVMVPKAWVSRVGLFEVPHVHTPFADAASDHDPVIARIALEPRN